MVAEGLTEARPDVGAEPRIAVRAVDAVVVAPQSSVGTDAEPTGSLGCETELGGHEPPLGEIHIRTSWVGAISIGDHRLSGLDMIHNLRSALDHALWAVPRLNGEEPFDRSQFPLCTSEEAWNGRTNRETMAQLPLGLVAFIDDIQPYRRARPHRLVLARLAALDNEDKHRIVQPTLVSTEDLRFEPEPLPLGLMENKPFFAHVPLRVGVPLCRVRFLRPPESQDELKAVVSMEVAFGDGVKAWEALSDFSEAVHDIVQMIEFCIEWSR